MLYYAREGVLAAGFLLYAAVAQRRRAHPLAPDAADRADAVMVALFAGSTLALNIPAAAALRIPLVLVVALLVGVTGGMVYERIALEVHRLAAGENLPGGINGDATSMLGLIVGGGGALAVVLQFALQTGFDVGMLLDVLFVVGFGVLVWLGRKLRPVVAEGLAQGDASLGESAEEPDSGGLDVVTFACMTVASTCLFALLPFYEAAVHASGAPAAFYEWYRLFLAAGYVFIGAVAYRGGRRAASVVVLVLALFAVIVSAQTAMMETGAPTTILFYFLLAVVLAWSNIAFMSVAAQSALPALVASMGRILVALVTAAEILLQVAGPLPLMAVLTVSLVLLAAVVIAMVRGGFLQDANVAAEESDQLAEDPEPAPSPEERALLLAAECGLTEREQEVLVALVLTEDTNQQIADSLGISRRRVQTYVSRIYEKTGTLSRAGLIMRASGEERPR